LSNDVLDKPVILGLYGDEPTYIVKPDETIHEGKLMLEEWLSPDFIGGASHGFENG